MKYNSNSDLLYKKAEQILNTISQQNIGLVKTGTPAASFELYVYSLVLEAINSKISKPNITIVNPQNSSHIFKPKLSPGLLNYNKYSYVEYIYKNNTFEVHLDTQYPGYSRAYHEIDISIITPHFKDSFLYLAIECKNIASPLPFKYAREFVGALSDFHQTKDQSAKIRNDFLVTSAKKLHPSVGNFMGSKRRAKSRFNHSFAIENLKGDLSEEKHFKSILTACLF